MGFSGIEYIMMHVVILVILIMEPENSAKISKLLVCLVSIPSRLIAIDVIKNKFTHFDNKRCKINKFSIALYCYS